MIPAEQALTILARQAVSALGVDLLQDIGRRAEGKSTGQMTLNFLDGHILSWTMLERFEKLRRDGSKDIAR